MDGKGAAAHSHQLAGRPFTGQVARGWLAEGNHFGADRAQVGRDEHGCPREVSELKLVALPYRALLLGCVKKHNYQRATQRAPRFHVPSLAKHQAGL